MYRQLLPRPSDGLDTPPGPEGPEGGSPSGSRPRAACHTCRARKSKCDGKRPDCSSCRKRGVSCAYDDDARPDLQRDFETLKLRYEELLRLFELLRTASDDAARQTLGKIRRGRSAKDVLQEAEAYDLPRSPSPLPVTGSILNLPETSIELEMVVRYPKVYTPILPLDPSAVDLGLLGLEFARSMRPHERVWEATHHLATGSALPLSTSLDPAQLMRSGEGEGTAPSQEHWRNNVYDERLRRLDISYWTKVPVSDDFAAGAINIYLTYEYPILGLFDADAFLDDLCEQKHLFCSSLLVNSLLAWMCHGYSYKDPSAASLAGPFFSEATRQWEENNLEDTLPTISAAIFLNLASNSLGRDVDGMRFHHASAEMARRLHLIDDRDGLWWLSPSPPGCDGDTYERASSAVAWSVHNWQLLHSFNFHRLPSITHPPLLPIPYVDSPKKSPRYINNPCRPLSKFWIIMHEMVKDYYSDTPRISLSTAEAIYRKLLSWSDDLPNHLSRVSADLSHVLTMHIYFHTAVIDLFRPFATSPDPQHISTVHRAAPDSTPQTIVAASIKQLQRLVYDYRSTFESACCSLLWHTSMLYLVNDIIRRASSPEGRFYFLLCMQGYQKLARHIPLVGGIVRSILSMALRAGAIAPADAAATFEHMRLRQPATQRDAEQSFSSRYPVDLGLAMTDIEAASLETLVKYFEDTVLKGRGEEAQSEDERHAGIWRGPRFLLDQTLAESPLGIERPLHGGEQSEGFNEQGGHREGGDEELGRRLLN